jgi:hypothetical protein
MRRIRSLLALALIAAALVTAPAPATAAADRRPPPPWIRGEIHRAGYDGVTDDLLT